MESRLRCRGHETGANLVEAAIGMPLLLVLLAGGVDIGRAYLTYITVINATREGARYAVQHCTDPAGITARVVQEAQLSSVNLGTASIVTSSSCASGTPVRVSVSLSYPLIMGGIIGLPTFPIGYSVSFPVK
jgi:Flp pilus assembly protein TadG